MYNSWILTEFHSLRSLMSTNARSSQRCQASRLTDCQTHAVVVAAASASILLCRSTKEWTRSTQTVT